MTDYSLSTNAAAATVNCLFDGPNKTRKIEPTTTNKCQMKLQYSMILFIVYTVIRWFDQIVLNTNIFSQSNLDDWSSDNLNSTVVLFCNQGVNYCQ